MSMSLDYIDEYCIYVTSFEAYGNVQICSYLTSIGS